jgi:large subunit ribosomal protein L53
MITRFIAEVTTKFNPFSARAKVARLFLSNLPPNARKDGMNISTEMLSRNSVQPALLSIKFSTYKAHSDLHWTVFTDRRSQRMGKK